MMEGIRRIGRRPMRGDDRWDADRELEPEVEADFEFPGEDAVMVSQTRAPPAFVSNYSSGVEYQRNLVLTAIEQGGELGGHQISLPWLKTILAGLEGRHVEPDAAWEGFEAPNPVQPRAGPESPSYCEVFPAEKEAAWAAPG